MQNGTGLRIAHVQPMTLDLYGHSDDDFGTRVTFYLSNLPAAQARLGMRPTVHLLTSGRPHQLRFDGVEVRFHRCLQPPRSARVNSRFARQFSSSMLHAISHTDADVVHCYGPRQLHVMYAAVARRARKERLPLVGHDQGPRPVGHIERWFQRHGLKRTQFVLASSPSSVDEFLGLGVRPERLRVMPNGFDPQVFYPGAERHREPGDPFRILVVSRLWEDKDPLTMADGIAELVRQGRDVELTIISGGPMKPQVEARLSRAQVPTRFIEFIPQAELAVAYRSHDALVLTSLREGWNQAIVEALASGLPVITTDVPGPRDAAGEAGILIPPRNPLALAEALERLIDSPTHAAEHRALGLRRSKDFSWDAIAAMIAEVYRSVTAI
jgi:glycosyltransferase involved in cell wall biosynthesis